MVASFVSPRRTFESILPASPRVLQQAKFGATTHASNNTANTAFSSSSSSLSTLSLTLGNGEALTWQQLIDRLRQYQHHRHHDDDRQTNFGNHNIPKQLLQTPPALFDPSEQQQNDESAAHSPTSCGTSELIEHIVRITKGHYLNVGVPSFSSPGLCPYLYVHSVKRERRIIAQLVKYKKRNASPSGHASGSSSSSNAAAGFCKPVYTNQKLSIPLNYAGFFEILSEDGRATRCIHSISELLRRFPDACIVRSSGVRAYAPLVLGNQNGGGAVVGTHTRRPSDTTSRTADSNRNASFERYESMPNNDADRQSVFNNNDYADVDAERQQTASVASCQNNGNSNSHTGSSGALNVAVRFDKYRLLHPGERLVLVDSFKALIESSAAVLPQQQQSHQYFRDQNHSSVGSQSSTVPSGVARQFHAQLQVDSFLRCFDEAGNTMLLHVGDKGKFSPIAREEQISGVHTVQNLLRKRFPLTVRLVCGAVPLGLSTKKASMWPPLGSNSSSSAAPTAAAFNSNSNGYVVPNSSSAPQPLTFAMRLMRCYEEDFAQVFVWSQKEPLVLSIPLSATLKVAPAKNMPQLRLDADVHGLSLNMSRFLTERGGSNACLQMLTEKESVAHDVFAEQQQLLAAEKLSSTGPNSSSKTSASQNSNFDSTSAAAVLLQQKRRSKKTSLLNFTSKHATTKRTEAEKCQPRVVPPGLHQPPPKWTYDEIDQIYDYVRGLAPPPAIPFEIRDDDEDCQQVEQNPADTITDDAEDADITNNNYAIAAGNVINTAAHVITDTIRSTRFVGANAAANSTAIRSKSRDCLDDDTTAEHVLDSSYYYYDAATGAYIKSSDHNETARFRRDSNKISDRRRNTTDSVTPAAKISSNKYLPSSPPVLVVPVPPPIETIPTNRSHHQQQQQQNVRAFKHSASQDKLNTLISYPPTMNTSDNNTSTFHQQRNLEQLNLTPPQDASRKLLFSKFKYKSMNQLPTMHVYPQQSGFSATTAKRSPLVGAASNNSSSANIARNRRGVVSSTNTPDVTLLPASADDNAMQSLPERHQSTVMLCTPISAVSEEEPPYVNIGSPSSATTFYRQRQRNEAQSSNNNDRNLLPKSQPRYADVDENGVEYKQPQQQRLADAKLEERTTTHHPTNIVTSTFTLSNQLAHKHAVQSASIAETDTKVMSSSANTAGGEKVGISAESYNNNSPVSSPKRFLNKPLPCDNDNKENSAEPQRQRHLISTTASKPVVSSARRHPTTLPLPLTATTSANHIDQQEKKINSPFVNAEKSAAALQFPSNTIKLKPSCLASTETSAAPVNNSNSITTFKAPILRSKNSSIVTNRISTYLPSSSSSDALQRDDANNITANSGGVVVMRLRTSAAFDEAIDDATESPRSPTTLAQPPSVKKQNAPAIGMVGKLKQVARTSNGILSSQQGSSAGHNTGESGSKINTVANNTSLDSGTGTASSSSASSAASIDGVGTGGGGGETSSPVIDDATERSVHARIQKFHNMLVGSNSNVGSTSKQRQEHQPDFLATKAAGRRRVGLIYI